MRLKTAYTRQNQDSKKKINDRPNIKVRGGSRLTAPPKSKIWHEKTKTFKMIGR